MTESRGTTGEPRQGDRRATDRRRTDRRAPVPAWRSPPALVGYGVVGALLLVGLINLLRADRKPSEPPIVDAPARPAVTAAPAPAPRTGPTEPAYGTGDFERLVIEGQNAVGKRVRAELFCAPPTRMSLITGQPVEKPVAALADAEGKVSGAECKWGAGNDRRREDFVLVIPPALAERFAQAPVVTDDFVQRRRLIADVEWVGRSDALALRTAGVLRGVVPTP